MWCATCIAITEIITLTWRYLYLSVVAAKLIAKVSCKAVLSICATHILAIQQRKAVLDGECAVCVTASLQGIEIIVIARSVCWGYAFRQGSDILVYAILVVYAFAPVAHLFHIEHIKHIFEAHVWADFVSHLPQLVWTSPYKLPQNAVMPCEGIGANAFIQGLPCYGIVILQDGIIAFTKDGVHVVWNELPVKTVPCDKHHVLGTVIHCHEIVRYHIPCKWAFIVKVIIVLCIELAWISFAWENPRPKTLDRCLVFLIGGFPSVISLETELQCIRKWSHVSRAKQAKCLRVVQELQADTFVSLSVQSCCIIEAFNALKSIDGCTATFLIVEIVLAKVDVFTSIVIVIEQINRETIHTNTDIIVASICLLWWCEPSASLPDVIDYLHGSSVMSGRGIWEIRFQTENIYWTCAWLEWIGTFRNFHTIHIQLGSILAWTAEIQTVVLSWISGWWCSLYAQSALVYDEIIFLAIGRIEIDVNRHFKLLVVGLIHKIHIAHDAHHALALGSELIHINVRTFIIHHLIVLEQHNHFISSRTIHHVVGKFFIIAKRTVIDTDVSQFHICTIASNLDVDRCRLQKTVGVGILLRTAKNTVYIEFQQTVARLLLHDKGNFQVQATRKKRIDLRSCPCSHYSLLCGQLEADIAIHAINDNTVSVCHIGTHQFHFISGSIGCGIALEWCVTDFDVCPIGQFQSVTSPSVAFPVKAIERGSNAVISPFGRCTFTVASAWCCKFQLQARCCLIQVNATFIHINVEIVFSDTTLEFHLVCSLFKESVCVNLCGSWHTYILRLDVIAIYRHIRWCRCWVIGNELKFYLLILSSFQSWCQMVFCKDTTIRVRHHGSDKRRIAACFQNIHIDAIALQGQVCTCLHFCHHLDGVPSHTECGHWQRETAVGRSASCYGVGILLLAIHIKRHHLGSRATYCVWNTDGLVCPIATLCNGFCKVETACQG